MANILVNHKNFQKSIDDITNHTYPYKAVDTETEGLRPYQGHNLFSIIISTLDNDYYFNFNIKPDHLGQFIPTANILPTSWFKDFIPMFENINTTWYLHNAKFDMHFLAKENIYINGTIFCVKAMARLINNRLPFNYTLDNLAGLIGDKKDDTVKPYIMKHKIYTEVEVGKKDPRKDLHFDLVPWAMITEYGFIDGRITFNLGEYERKRLLEMGVEQIEAGLPDVMQVVRNEQKLTKTLFKSEKRGILIDVEYTKEALAYEEEMRDEYAAKFYAYTGEEYQDAPSLFKIVFKKLGLTPGKTPKGNDSYSEENLPDNAVTELILGWRKHNKRAVTYFRGFLDLVDKDGVIHCNFKQDGTVTGRMSSTNPNLQNVPKRGEDESEYPVRKCFIPRKGYVFAMLDYQAQEYRLLLDIANEKEVIRKIMEDGLDVHTATAEEMGTGRTAAKTLNFMLLYGGGAAKLASALSIAVTKAKQLKQKYFTSLRSVSGLVEALITTAKRRGYVVNWFGRRILLDEERSYTVPNHYIQGGCADITKLALNNVAGFLEKTTSHVLLQIHDELVYEINKEETNIIPTLTKLMEEVYPFTTLPMQAEADVGENLYEKEAYTDK